MKQKISFIITSPHYDSGMKSIGSKCIHAIKQNSILEKQIKAISKNINKEDYEIIFVNAIDHHRTIKYIEKKNLNIKYVYMNQKNLNHTGCFLNGLRLAKYDNIFNIEGGLVLSHHAISEILTKNKPCEISIGCINNRHKQHADLEIGCIIDSNNHINNMFFGLDNKYIGTICLDNTIKNFILDNFSIQQDKNKYIFEIINKCISEQIICKKINLKSKDTHLIFNKKSLQQYIG